MTEDTGLDAHLDEPGVPSEEGESWDETAERLGTPDTLADLHEYPWSDIEGSYVRVEQEVDDRDPLDPDHDDRRDLVHTEKREGTIVGRGEGTGLYYDTEHGETVPTSIGPSIYLSTPADTVLEVRTSKPGNELLAFDAGGEDGE